MPLTAITHDSRHPFETYILAAGVVAGVAAVFGGLWPRSIEAVFNHAAQATWGVFLGGGAILALVGISMKKREVGIFLEQIGLLMFGGACGTYGVALLILNFAPGFAIGVFMLLVGAASVRQWFRLEKAVRKAIILGAIVRRRLNGRH